MIPPLPRFNRRVAADKTVFGRPTLESDAPALRCLWFAERDALCLVWQHGTISRTVRRVAWRDVLGFTEIDLRRYRKAQRFGTGLHGASVFIAHRAGAKVQVQPLELCSDHRVDLQRAQRFFERFHPATASV